MKVERDKKKEKKTSEPDKKMTSSSVDFTKDDITKATSQIEGKKISTENNFVKGIGEEDLVVKEDGLRTEEG